MPLDETKLEALRRWGQGLRGAGNEEHAAAGRAILMLIEEIERVRLELLRAREQSGRAKPESDEVDEDAGGRLASTLQGRLQRTLRRGSDASLGSRPELAEKAEAGTGGERAITSPEAWIESLRQRK